jgi:hypothetical protein
MQVGNKGRRVIRMHQGVAGCAVIVVLASAMQEDHCMTVMLSSVLAKSKKLYGGCVQALTLNHEKTLT